MAWNEVEIRGIEDPYRNAADKGWDIVDASQLADDLILEADVVIVGSGAGGGTAAEALSAAGLKVIILEEGMLKSSDQFDMVEREAFTDLYQEGGLRRTKDGGILIVQGRGVGGGTTVNWCSTFRTPNQTLNHWREAYGLADCGPDEMAPHFEAMEQRLNVSKWASPPNANNAVLQRGAEQLGYSWDTIPRNVAGCWDTGYCGVGCPVDAKKSMLVTTVPAALDHEATLIYRVEVQGVTISGDQVTGIEGYAKSPDGGARTGRRVTVRARHTILSAGAINTPGILLRSNVPDPYGRIGKRTFLHPVTISLAQFDEPIDPFYGAPQSIYSDQFNWAEGVVGPMGYKLEVIPLLPGTFAAVVGGHGIPLENAIQRHAYTQGTMAFLRDGFHEDSQGGAVELGDTGTPVLDYPVTEYIQDGARRALADMMEIQFAAGAKAVKPSHAEASWYSSLEEGSQALSELSFGWGKVRLSSAHAMGGCAMGDDETICVTDNRGRFRHLGNLSIFDGSLFPTGLGANPQMSIFGFVHKFAEALGNELAQ